MLRGYLNSAALHQFYAGECATTVLWFYVLSVLSVSLAVVTRTVTELLCSELVLTPAVTGGLSLLWVLTPPTLWLVW